MLYAGMAQQRSLHSLVGTHETDRIPLQLHLLNETDQAKHFMQVTRP